MTQVTAALIVRDAESTLPACLESIRPHVDALVVVDTGSTDRSVEIAKEFGAKVEVWTECNRNPLTGQLEPRIWDFAAARNRSFELVETEFVWWQDADDEVIGAEHLRPAALAAPPGPFAYLAAYEYSYADAAMTQPTCIHWRERLIRNPKDMVWTTPCHEVCVPRSGGIQHAPLPGVVIKHRAQKSTNPREPARNLRILDAYIKRSGEGDVRAMYYYGVELARHGKLGRAREVLRRYVELGTWTDEKCLGELELGRILLQEGDNRGAIDWALRALTTKSWPDPYWLLAKIFWMMAQDGAVAEQEYNLRRCYTWAERGRPLQDAETVLFYNPTERYEVERMVNRIEAHFGELDKAAESCRRGLAGMPGDPDLLQCLRGYEAERIMRELDTAMGRLVHLGVVSEQVREAIGGLLTGQIRIDAPPPANDVPHPFARIGTGEAVDTEGLPPVPEGKLDIVIVTGPAFEEWSPRTIEETGIGGSETMAWEMARHLARLGHRVRHYGWCRPEQEGQYEGVWWYDSTRYRDIRCDALVVSRYADLIQCVGGTKAKARLLWVHDVHVGAALTPAHALRFDRILCLSSWHKSFFCETYPFVDPERVWVTRNGIDLSLFEQPTVELHPEGTATDPRIKRNPHRAVYSSSPDRGLQTALELWPLVRAEVPDAELHVFYGFEGLKKAGPGNVALADKLEAQCKATAGVVLHGRVSPRELAREFMRSGVWFYPTWFSETSCITAMQAQAAGLRIVTSPIAALPETVSTAGVLIPGAPGPIDINQSFECAPCSDAYKHEVVAAVVSNLREEKYSAPFAPGDREKLEKEYPGEPIQNLWARATPIWDVRECAKRFALPTLAEDWSAMLQTLVTEQAMPRFYVDPAMAEFARETDREDAA